MHTADPNHEIFPTLNRKYYVEHVWHTSRWSDHYPNNCVEHMSMSKTYMCWPVILHVIVSTYMYMYVRWLKKLVKVTTTRARAHVSVWDYHMMSSQLAALKGMFTTTLTLQPSTMPSDVTLLAFEVAPVPNIVLAPVSPSSCDTIIVLNFVSLV